MYNVSIQMVRNGFIVSVGCWTLVFEDREKMLSELTRYYRDMQAVVAEYMEKYGKVQIEPQPVAAGISARVCAQTNPYRNTLDKGANL